MAIDAPGQMSGGPPLSQAWGYGVVLGIGALFALGMVSGYILYLLLGICILTIAGCDNLGSQALQPRTSNLGNVQHCR